MKMERKEVTQSSPHHRLRCTLHLPSLNQPNQYSLERRYACPFSLLLCLIAYKFYLFQNEVHVYQVNKAKLYRLDKDGTQRACVLLSHYGMQSKEPSGRRKE